MSGDERLPRGEIGIGRGKGGHSVQSEALEFTWLVCEKDGRLVRRVSGRLGKREGVADNSQVNEEKIWLGRRKRKQRGLFVMRCGQSLPGSALSFSAEDLRALMRYGIIQYDRIL